MFCFTIFRKSLCYYYYYYFFFGGGGGMLCRCYLRFGTEVFKKVLKLDF